MGALISLPITLLNFLLPFTKPGTPLVQDLAHTFILCGTLYFAPQIAEWYSTRQQQDHAPAVADDGQAEQDRLADIPEPVDPPLDERLIFQPDDEDDLPRPPPAPTPPPNHAQPAAPPFNDQPGPANHPQQQQGPRPTPQNRTIGAKKAKSLAAKDQRRAYHEFHRQEAELRRLQEAEGAAERDAALQAEKERRAGIEAQIAEKEREERARRKEEERKEAAEEQDRRDRVIQRVRDEVMSRGAVDLVKQAWKEGKDRVWVERLVRAGGLLSQLSTGGGKAIITGQGWLIRVDADIMAQAYKEAEMWGNQQGGKVSLEEVGGFVERAVRERMKVRATL